MYRNAFSGSASKYTWSIQMGSKQKEQREIQHPSSPRNPTHQ